MTERATSPEQINDKAKIENKQQYEAAERAAA
jgi:transposase